MTLRGGWALLRPILAVFVLLLALRSGGAARAPSPTAHRLVGLLVRARLGVNLVGAMTIVQPTADSMARTITRRIVRSRTGAALLLTMGPAAERGQVVSDDGVWVRRYDPGANVVRVKRSFERRSSPEAQAKLARLIERNYSVALEGPETCAGRPCERMLLTPRHTGSRTVRLWVDRETGVDLWREESDPQGNTVYTAVYTSITYPTRVSAGDLRAAIPAGARTVAISRAGLHADLAGLRRSAGLDVVMPMALPGGYEFDQGTVVDLAGGAATCLRFTDGLAELTVLQRARPDRPTAPARRFNIQVLSPGEVVVNMDGPGVDATVIGHCDSNVLVAVATSIDPACEKRLVALLAGEYGLPSERLVKWRDRGLGLAALAGVLELARRTHRGLDALARQVAMGGSWEAILSRSGVDPALPHRLLARLLGNR